MLLHAADHAVRGVANIGSFSIISPLGDGGRHDNEEAMRTRPMVSEPTTTCVERGG